jgi:hypothetical protein
MKTKRTVTHNSTKKNKRTMSGGKGIISTYTRRFKDLYKKFIGISDTDNTKKIKKMEAWGGLTGIYKFLKVDEKTFKNTNGDELSALEKMKENINNTPLPDSSNITGYLNAINCLEKDGDNILFEGDCVSYDDFVNGRATEAVAPAEGDSGTNNTVAVTSSNETPEGSPGEDKPVQNQNGPYDSTLSDVEAGDADNADNADNAGNAGDAGDADNAGDAEVADAFTDSTESGSGNETDSLQTGTLSTSGSDEPHGGGSKRRLKSSRRVKFGKSKKGRTTRRIVRKHRR